MEELKACYDAAKRQHAINEGLEKSVAYKTETIAKLNRRIERMDSTIDNLLDRP